MAVNHPAPASRANPRTSARRQASALTGGGTTGNERLTASTGTVLLVLLAVIGVTLIQLRQLLSVHMFVGMLLIGPLALKLASTGYRFVRYYTGDAVYRRKGPPAAPLRVLAPLLVVSTAVVLVSGVALLLIGPSSRGEMLPIHKISFIAWVGLMGLHVLAHLPSLPRALRGDYSRSAALGEALTGRSGRGGRTLALAGAIVAGLVVALLVLPDFAPWLHSAGLHDRGGG